MTRAEKAARIGELVLEILELAAEAEENEADEGAESTNATAERPKVVVDDVARQRANAALRRLGLLPPRGSR